MEGFSPEMEWIPPDILPDPGPFRGPEGVRRFWEMWGDAFEEFRVEPQEYVDAGDVVVVIVKIEARGHSGAAVDTPSFPNVWTARGGVPVRVEMFTSRPEALAAAGLPPDSSFERM
jgi:ketosteroid isomerase-like protein